MEKMKDQIFQETGGRVGQDYSPHTRTAKVKDIFQDPQFPPSSKSWFKGNEVPDYSSLQKPDMWRRLQEMVMDAPYPFSQPGIVPRAGRIYQGILEDFYLIAGMQAVAMKPWLIGQIFADMKFSDPSTGVYILRLYKHGQWHHVVIDDAIPFDRAMNPLTARTEFWPSLPWPALVEKAYAKLHGSWESLGGGGHVEEVMTDLTGGCSTRFGTADVAQDRLWQYMYFLQDMCLFGCNINDKECSKRRIPMEQHYASAIFRLQKYEGVPYVCVCMSAPSLAVARMPSCKVPVAEGYGIAEGFVWLRIDDFVELFDTIYECRLVNSISTLGNLSPGWIPGEAFFEEIYAFQGDVYTETSPSFLMEILETPNELVLEVTQTDLRYGDNHDTPELSRAMQAPLLLRFFQCSKDVDDNGGGEIYMVHMSAWGHTRDASCSVKVMKPGKYLAMVSIPAKYTCHRMIFRCYSTRPLVMKPITQHRQTLLRVPSLFRDGRTPKTLFNPTRNAIPYSLCGFQRVDALSEKLPQTPGRRTSLALQWAQDRDFRVLGCLVYLTLDYQAGGTWVNRIRNPLAGLEDLSLDMQGYTYAQQMNNPGHLKTVGAFGGQGAVASVSAAEVQDANCCIT
ncbi:unnamed protein product [Durusdinium trenchii]|uniref:Calpain catalytic domain-containing protein n=1 Tax=Durusdinium trenchii TaxID=1381693 RepID=A0ABP0KBW6_9DINO